MSKASKILDSIGEIFFYSVAVSGLGHWIFIFWRYPEVESSEIIRVLEVLLFFITIMFFIVKIVISGKDILIQMKGGKNKTEK